MAKKYYIVGEDEQGNNPYILKTDSTVVDFEMAGPFHSEERAELALQGILKPKKKKNSKTKSVYDLLEGNNRSFMKKIKSHELIKDFGINESGGFEITFKSKPNEIFFATPFWENSSNIIIEQYTDEGKQIDVGLLELNEDIKVDEFIDYEEFADWYFDRISAIYRIALSDKFFDENYSTLLNSSLFTGKNNMIAESIKDVIRDESGENQFITIQIKDGDDGEIKIEAKDFERLMDEARIKNVTYYSPKTGERFKTNTMLLIETTEEKEKETKLNKKIETFEGPIIVNYFEETGDAENGPEINTEFIGRYKNIEEARKDIVKSTDNLEDLNDYGLPMGYLPIEEYKVGDFVWIENTILNISKINKDGTFEGIDNKGKKYTENELSYIDKLATLAEWKGESLTIKEETKQNNRQTKNRGNMKKAKEIVSELKNLIHYADDLNSDEIDGIKNLFPGGYNADILKISYKAHCNPLNLTVLDKNSFYELVSRKFSSN